MNQQSIHIGMAGNEEFYCEIRDYAHHRSMLSLRITSTDDAQTGDFTFFEVRYFSGPTRWIGTMLSLGSREELLSLLSRTSPNFDEQPALADYFQIFVSRSRNLDVKLVASKDYIERAM